MTQPSISTRILDWYDQHGRKHLPWQKNRTAYRVWLSEIMLQQTQVATVIPYYERFTQRFPTVYDLALAKEDDVLSLWTGLGYYARARNLHKCAMTVVEQHDGEFPNTVESLALLPGIGRSTAGAIASLAYGVSAPILDGNVKRTLTRYHGVYGWPGQTKVANELWQYAISHTPETRNADYTQAMMDHGATLCTRRRPQCNRCPIRTDCVAYRKNITEQLPEKKPKKSKPVKQIYMLVLLSNTQKILLEKRPSTGIWGGLWSLPECKPEEDINLFINNHFGHYSNISYLAPFRHTFSHYHLDINPILIQGDETQLKIEDKPQKWFRSEETDTIGLPAPIKLLLDKCYSGKNQAIEQQLPLKYSH